MTNEMSRLAFRQFVAPGCLLALLGAPQLAPAQTLEPGVHLTVRARTAAPPGGALMVASLPRSLVDRPDDAMGPQVQLFYILPSDGIDEQLDTNGQIATSFAAAQRWLVRQTQGKWLRLDTYAGAADIVFVRLTRTDAQLRAAHQFVRDEIEDELAQNGLLEPSKIYLAYYGGSSDFSCGGGAWPPALPGQLGALYLYGEPPNSLPCSTNEVGLSEAEPGYWEFGGLHELMHTKGFVGTCGTNYVATGHVTDDPHDLMWAGPQPWQPKSLDVGRDDYYQHQIPGCLDLSNSVFLEPAPAGAGTCLFDLSPTQMALTAASGTQSLDVSTAPDCVWQPVKSASWVHVGSTGTEGPWTGAVWATDNPMPFVRSATISIGGATMTVTQQAAAAPSNVVQNGTFAAGPAGWYTYATPDPGHLMSNTDGNVFQFFRLAPPPGTAGQGLVFQETGIQVPANAPLHALFDLGNSSSVRKRVSVLLHDSNFTDLSVCTFWLAPGTPLQTYAMRSHTTKAWTNATISFYAATTGSDGGFYRLDNVSMQYQPSGSATRTDCVDPAAPSGGSGAPSPSVLTNGDFAAGLSPWSVYGQITWNLNSNVFNFSRPPGTPAGVVFQGTSTTVSQSQVLGATFDLGNAASVRQRVTVLLHDGNFADLSACTFWLAPGAPMGTFSVRTYATRPWTNATISIYHATIGVADPLRLDNVTLQVNPATAVLGTECTEPAPPAPASAASRRGGL